MRQLTSMDSTFIYIEGEGKHNHLTGVYIYDQSTAKGGRVRFKDIMKHVESRLHRSPVFRQKLVEVPLSVDYPYWVDDEDFDIEFHVRHIALPKPGDWRQFCILVSRLHSRPLDMSRPAWEMYIVEGLDGIEGLPPGCFAVVAKYHHAAIDGATGIEIIGALHDLTPAKAKKGAAPEWQPEAPPSTLGLLGRMALNNIRHPFQLTRSVASTLPTLGRHLLRREQKTPENDSPVPDTRFNDRVSPHRVFDGRQFEFADFRAIKNAQENTTVNDVVLAVVAGAVRLYLQDKDELPEESLVAMVPINTRVEQDETPGNQLSAMSCALNTQIEDPVERLAAITQATRQAKETASGVGARQMTDIHQHVPSGTLALAGRLVNALALGTRTRFCNCVVTNVPGPQHPLYKNGAKLVSMWGCGPMLDGVGLFIAANSYDGRIFLSITSCREIMPDVGFFADCLQESFDELSKASLGGKQAKKRKAPKKTAKKAIGKRA